MRNLIIPAIAVFALTAFASCKSSSGKGEKPFCDTACIRDTMKFTGEFPLKPYVYITPKNCGPDSIIWSYKGLGNNRKMGFTSLLRNPVSVNPKFIRCFFRDTAVVFIMLNDCITGRGYQVRLPFDKKKNIEPKSSGINNFDPKFSVSDNLLVNTDRGNIYVEDMITGKKAMMTFGKALDIDYDAIHDHIDSVNVTADRIWVKIKVDEKWVEKEKKITLE